MRFSMSKWRVVFVLLVSLPALAACGGGGSSSGGSGGSVPTAYNGVTTQAAVTTNNAQTLATGAYEDSVSGSQVGQAVSLAAGGGSSTPAFPGMVQVAQLLKTSVLQSDPLGVQPAATTSNTLQGDCGGSASYTINGNQSTGAFSGSFTFSGYCSGGTTLTGGMSVSGQIDLNTANPTQINMSIPSLTVSDGTDSGTLSGTIGIAFSNGGNNTTGTFNIVLTDAATQKSFWLDNLVVTTVSGTNSDQMTLSGKFFDPDYGYIGISTPTTLTIPTTGGLPTAGVLLFSGKNNSAAELTFSTGGTTLQVDANGDGTFETTISNPI